VQAFAVAVTGQSNQYIPHPATWFNQERWTDDRATWVAWKDAGKPDAKEEFSPWD